jgi:PAS domain S-box-containing protein
MKNDFKLSTSNNLSAEAYIKLFENSSDAILVADNSANYVEMNEAACQLFGYGKDEFLTKSVKDVSPVTSIEETKRLWEIFLSQKEMEGEFDIVIKSGEIRKTHFRAVTNFIPGYHLSILRDVTDRNRSESERESMVKLLAIINAQNDSINMLQEVANLIKEWSGSEAVAIRQRVKEDYPYCSTYGLPEHFIKLEDSICRKDLEYNDINKPLSAPNGNLVCVCGAVINNMFDVNSHLFTEYGSFITNNSSLDSLTIEKFVKTPVRGTCVKMGFESMLLIPLRSGKETYGLLQLMDTTPDKFTKDKISFLERVAANLSIAIAHKKGQAKLRESEKKHRQLFETMGQGVVYSNKEGIVTSANPAALNILGREELDFIGGKIFEEGWGLIKEDGTPFTFEDFPLQLALRTGKEIQDVLLGFYNPKRKGQRWIKVNCIPQFNNGDSIPYQVYTIIEDISEQKAANDQIKNSLHEKETLLKEIHHRVKNNLQIISSLLNLQSGYLKDQETIEILRESQNRVRSMALIHERLYRSEDFSSVDFNKFLVDLTNILQSSYYNVARLVALNLNLEQIYLSIDIAIPLGLLINEIVSNSFKHAFVDKKDGKIEIEMLRKKDKIFLSIKDNGIGIPEKFNAQESETLGFKLIHSLVSQIDATIEIKKDNGTEIILSFGMGE